MVVVGSKTTPLFSGRQELASFLTVEASHGAVAEPLLSEAARKISEGAELDNSEVVALEGLVLAQLRPMLPIRHGSFNLTGRAGDLDGRWSSLLEMHRDRLRRIFRSVVRLDVTPPIAGLVCAGTGFLVADDLIMTGRNVVELFATGLGMKDLTLRSGQKVEAVFLGVDSEGRCRCPVLEIIMIHPVLDIAMLRINPPSWSIEPLALSTIPAEDLSGEAALIGHVGFDQRRDLGIFTSLFAQSLGGMHVSPGYFIEPQIISRHGHSVWAIAHDCSTLAGYSGAPLIDLATGMVVGVQSGTGLLENFAVPTRELARDARIVNTARLSWSGDVDASPGVWSEYWGQADGEGTPATPSVMRGPEFQRRAAREAARQSLGQSFRTGDDLAKFLVSQGYGRVVDAVPNTGSDESYVDGLLRALERRDLLEDVAAALTPLAGPAPLAFQEELPAAVIDIVVAGVQGFDDRAMPELTKSAGSVPSPPDPSQEAVLARVLREPGLTDIAYLARGVEAGRAVVLVNASHPPRGSTGWLLTPSLVVVPAHLVAGPGLDGASQAASGFTVRFDFDDSAAPPLTMGVRGIELIDHRLDLVLLRLDEPVHDRAPLTVNADLPRIGAGLLTMIHHPALRPKMLSVTTEGLLAFDAHNVIYDLHTEAGSGGGPVFDAEWRVLATHRALQFHHDVPDAEPRRAKAGTATYALLKSLREGTCASSGADVDPRRLWREVVAAQPALKFVDPTLLARLAQPGATGSPVVAAVVVETLDEATVLEDVPGLQISTRAGTLVTGFGTLSAVEALADRAEVLAVRGSSATGSVECALSIPHTGVCEIHTDVGERGDAALVAVIDSGADVLHHALQDQLPDGIRRTRIVAFWDQRDTRAPAPNSGAQTAVSMSAAGRALVDECGLTYGALYIREDLQSFIDGAPMPATFPSVEAMAHGTSVCSIAAGRRTGSSSGHFFGGAAPAAELIVVRYDLQDATVGYSAGHIDALAFIDHMAARLGKPVVVNISNGMNAGAHDGTSDVEVRCEAFSDYGRKPGRIIVKSAGNERGKGRHAKIKLGQGSVTELRWRSMAVDPSKPSRPEVIELWFDHLNEYAFRLKPPGSDFSPEIGDGFDEILANGNRATCALRQINPENGDGSLHIRVSAGNVPTVESGEWLLEIGAVTIRAMKPIHAWLDEPFNRELKFRDHLDDEVTITIPGTAPNVITVGAVEVSKVMRAYAHSSLGPARRGEEKPDLVAPGVALRAALAGSTDGINPTTDPKSGTSLAAPHVTGAIALALSAQAKRAGAVQFNANQIKSALRRSARHLSVWSETTGYGELDAERFLKELGLI